MRNRLAICGLSVILLFANWIHSQELTVAFKPVYIIVTTSLGVENVNIKECNVVEEEFFDKVTSKNDALLEVHIPDATKRIEFLNTYQKAIASHKDDIHVVLPCLSK